MAEGLPEQRSQKWDIFRMDHWPKERDNARRVSQILPQILKVLTYILMVLIITTGVVFAKGGLQVLTTILGQHNKFPSRTVNQDLIAYLLLFSIITPDVFNCLNELWKAMLGNRKTATWDITLKIIIRECLHSFGLAVLLFLVLPYMDPIQACVVINATTFLPGFIHMVMYCRENNDGKGEICRKIKIVLNIISSVVLLVSVALVLVSVGTSERKNIYARDPAVGNLLVWTIVSIITLSSRWIPQLRNKEDENESFNREENYAVIKFVSRFLRICITVTLFWTLLCPGIRGIEDVYEKFLSTSKAEGLIPANCTMSPNRTATLLNPKYKNVSACVDEGIPLWEVLGPFLSHVIGAILTMHVGVLACRLQMQRIGYSIPLSIASPIYVILVVILKSEEKDLIYRYFEFKNDSTNWMLFFVFLVAWLSQLNMVQHIWEAQRGETLFSANKLFVFPNFCGPLVDLSLLHSRKIKRKKELEIYADPSGTKVFICATMWHENRTEMKQLLSSIFRLRNVQRNYGFEAHIMFDDAMETSSGSNLKENDFVKQFMEVVEEVGIDFDVNVGSPYKFATPYGGRVEWKLTEGCKLIVHLKYKGKIRHKKRWSQIMYMYYIVGYKLITECAGIDKIENPKPTQSIFEILPINIREKAENWFILALDGDVDFQPNTLQLLIDRMKVNFRVGSVCGRIKPCGSGPVVWYQKFEYAVGHWLQKSAEHVFGSVLCSPGCFSLFRVKALMDDNIMRTYATLPTEPRHYIQYDQGEDRWLSTLMLQQGYKIEYSAAAEAATFAPEDFKEFFKQRRRWIPSTMANLMDLLSSSTRTTKMNPNISYLFVTYQVILFLSSIFGPSTVLLALQSALGTVFGIHAWLTYSIIFCPVVVFVIVCLKCKDDTQLNVAMALSTAYALLMMAVLAGTLVSIFKDGWFTPTGMFFYILTGMFIIAGLLHPDELGDLLKGLLYFICIPAGYLFLIIYAICNLNNISWGTRENTTAVLKNADRRSRRKETEKEIYFVTTEMIEGMVEQARKTVSNSSISIIQWFKNLVLLKSLESVQAINEKTKDVPEEPIERRENMPKDVPKPAFEGVRGASIFKKGHTDRNRRAQFPGSSSQLTQIDEVSWTSNETEEIHTTKLDQCEEQFWNALISTYLRPIDDDPDKKKNDSEKLSEFRYKAVFAFLFLNGLWLAIMISMNEIKNLINITIPQPSGPPKVIEPLGFLFLVIFSLMLLLQFIGMLLHRYETFYHILSRTKVDCPCSAQNTQKGNAQSREDRTCICCC